MNSESMRVLARATTATQLPEVAGWIHDQVIAEGCVRHDPERAVLEIEFWLMLHERRELIRSIWIRKDWRYPLARSVLRIRSVEGWRKVLDHGTGTYELVSIEYEPAMRRLTIDTAPPHIIEVTVTALDVEAATSDEPTGWRRIIDYGVGESWSHRKGRLYIP